MSWQTIKLLFKLLVRSTSRVIIAKSWTKLWVHCSVYQIVPTEDGRWAADVILWLTPPTGDSKKDYTLVLPLNICFDTQSMVFVTLQIVGGAFIGTVDKVSVLDKNKNVEKHWYLSKSLEEQGIDFNPTDFLKSVTGLNVSPETTPQEEKFSEDTAKPTHTGNKTRN